MPHHKRFTNEEIINAYKDTGSVWKAAKKLGCVGQSVWERLKVIGHPMLSCNWTEEEEAELRSLIHHCSLTEIAQRLGRPYFGVAMKASKLGICTRVGSRLLRKPPPRGVGLNKATTKKIVRDLEKFDGSWRQFCRSRGFTLDSLAKALQTYAPEFWLREAAARGLNPKICPNCDAEYFPITAKQKTCTRRCQGQQRANQQYFGGKRNTAVGLLEGVCQLCLRERKHLSAHHVLGKQNDPENEMLVALCRGCHQIVGVLGAMKLGDTKEGWERLIELVMARRLADQPKRYAGTRVYVDIEYLTERDCIDSGILPEPEPKKRTRPYPVESAERRTAPLLEAIS